MTDTTRQRNKAIALIPARGGSKGIKDKNIVPLAGKPLLGYAIEAALRSGVVGRVVVSSDSGRNPCGWRCAGRRDVIAPLRIRHRSRQHG